MTNYEHLECFSTQRVNKEWLKYKYKYSYTCICVLIPMYLAPCLDLSYTCICVLIPMYLAPCLDLSFSRGCCFFVVDDGYLCCFCCGWMLCFFSLLFYFCCCYCYQYQYSRHKINIIVYYFMFSPLSLTACGLKFFSSTIFLCSTSTCLSHTANTFIRSRKYGMYCH